MLSKFITFVHIKKTEQTKVNKNNFFRVPNIQPSRKVITRHVRNVKVNVSVTNQTCSNDHECIRREVYNDICELPT